MWSVLRFVHEPNRDLRKKMDDMADAANTRQESEKELLLVASESKAKQLQASLNRKDALIKDLRDKVEDTADQECHFQHKEQTDKQARSIQTLRKEINIKESELKNCQQILAQVTRMSRLVRF